MMDPAYHLRRERLIYYQLAMLISLAAECTATYSLSKYEDLQEHVEKMYTRKAGFPITGASSPSLLLIRDTNSSVDGYDSAHVYNNDLLDCEISTIVFCVLVACIFGADFFFLTMFPRQTYPKWYNMARKGFAVFIALGMLASAIASSVCPLLPSCVRCGD